MSSLKQNESFKTRLTILAKTKKPGDIYTVNNLSSCKIKHTLEFLQNLALLKLPENYISALSDVSNILRETMSSEEVEVNGLISSKEFFNLLANKKFPSTTYIRSQDELNISKPRIYS